MIPPSAKIIVQVSPGELLDKYTILQIKLDRISDPEKLKYISNELKAIHTLVEQTAEHIPRYAQLVAELKSVNSQLWDVEDSLRLKEAEQNFDTHFVELARSVYQLNDRRASIKLDINQCLNCDIAEQKQHPAY